MADWSETCRWQRLQRGVHRRLLHVGEQRGRYALTDVRRRGSEGRRGREVAGARHEKQRRGDGLGDVACRLAGRHVQGQLVHDAFERVGGRHSRQSSVVGRSDAAVHGCCGGVVRELEVHRSGRQPDEKPAYSTEQDFWDGAAVLRSSLWDKVEGQVEPECSQALWELTLEEANKLGKGWLEGPLSKDQLDAMFPEGWSPCRRFAVWQGKWRPIDDFSECGINACFGCFERISLKALDEITWACVQIFRCAVTRGDVSFTLQDGSSLQGRLHSAWHDADKVRPLSKTYDLRAAYKQLPLHPSERRKAVIILRDPSSRRVHAFVCNTLPFGSTASVLQLNRISLLLQRIMCELGLVSACYYDDFPSVMPSMLGQGSDKITHTVMQLLGFDMSVDKESPYSPRSEMLGVILDTSDEAMGAVHLRNRPERSEAMCKSLGEVIESKKVSSRELPSHAGAPAVS